MNVLKLYPCWKEAVENLMNEDFSPGRVLTRAWLNEQFCLSEGDSKETYKKYSFEFLAAIEAFKQELLYNHQIAISAMRQNGDYIIVKPNEQTSWAEHTAYKQVFKAIKTGLERCINVDSAALTEDERRENTDAIGRLSWTRDAMAKHKKALEAKKQHLLLLEEE